LGRFYDASCPSELSLTITDGDVTIRFEPRRKYQNPIQNTSVNCRIRRKRGRLTSNRYRNSRGGQTQGIGRKYLRQVSSDRVLAFHSRYRKLVSVQFAD